MLSSLLVGVTDKDPATYVSVVLVLAVTAAVATWFRRDEWAEVDPTLALSGGSLTTRDDV